MGREQEGGQLRGVSSEQHGSSWGRSTEQSWSEGMIVYRSWELNDGVQWAPGTYCLQKMVTLQDLCAGFYLKYSMGTALSHPYARGSLRLLQQPHPPFKDKEIAAK